MLSVSKERVRENKYVLKEIEKEILVFLYDMKFGSVENVFNEVFKSREMSVQSAQKYLKNLEDVGLIRSHKGLDGTLRKWYFGTRKGWRVLNSCGLPRPVARANDKIWATTFFHDQMLIIIREKIFENDGKEAWSDPN